MKHCILPCRTLVPGRRFVTMIASFALVLGVVAYSGTLTATRAQGPQKKRVLDLGAQITSINPNGRAAQAGLEMGDIITHVGNVRVTSVQHLQKAFQAAAQSGGANVRVINVRDGQPTEVTVYPLPNGAVGINVAIVNLDPNPF